MKIFFKLIFLLTFFFLNFNFVFAENVGLSTYGLDLLNPNKSIDYNDANSNSAASFLGLKVSSFVNIIIGFAALFVFALVIYGGIVILFSNGKKDSYQKGLGVIKTTVIGLIIILFSYAIVSFFTRNVFNTTEPVKNSNTTGTTVACGATTCAVATHYCCTDKFFGCEVGKCVPISSGNGCACSGNTIDTCLGACTGCPNQVCPTSDMVQNYTGFCTPAKTNNHWYCKKK